MESYSASFLFWRGGGVTENFAIRKILEECLATSMDEAIAKRISKDHGVTVLEEDVIETLEKIKAPPKDKITGAEQPPVTAQAPSGYRRQ